MCLLLLWATTGKFYQQSWSWWPCAHANCSSNAWLSYWLWCRQNSATKWIGRRLHTHMRRLSQSQRTVASFQSGETIIGGRVLTSISSLKSGLVMQLSSYKTVILTAKTTIWTSHQICRHERREFHITDNHTKNGMMIIPVDITDFHPWIGHSAYSCIIHARYTFSLFLLLNDVIVAKQITLNITKCTDTKSNKLE